MSKETPDIYYSVIENSDQPNMLDMVYQTSPPRLRSVGKINTIFEMNDLMSRSLEIIAPYKQYPVAKDRTGFGDEYTIDKIIDEYGIYFAPDFPDFLIPWSNAHEYVGVSGQATRNIITWGTVRTEPGTTSQDSPFRGTQEIRPRHREYILYYGDSVRRMNINANNTTLANYKDRYAYLKVKAQYFDSLVQYNIWSKSNYEVERLADWFEDYMNDYRGMFLEAGVVNMYFSRRVRDDTLMQMKNGYHLRSVLYYIRTERVRPEIIGPINEIKLKISTENLQKYSSTEGRSIESSYDKIVSKWIQKNQLGG